MVKKYIFPRPRDEISRQHGVKVRRSVAGAQNWDNMPYQNGGSIQYEVIEEYAKPEWFKKIGDLSEYIN